VGGSMREIKNILLSKITAGVKIKITGYVFCIKKSEREQGYKKKKKKS
jgi:hypothetical protein